MVIHLIVNDPDGGACHPHLRDPSDTFRFDVRLEDSQTGQLVPYNQGEYYIVKTENGIDQYYKYENRQLVPSNEPGLTDVIADTLRDGVPVVIDGFINDWKKQVALDMIAPHFSYNGGQYENALANITTNADGRLVASTSISKLMGNGTLLDIGLEAEAQDNEILTTIAWNDNQPRPMKGSLRSTTELFRNEQGQQSAHIRVHPSEILVNDTVWRVEPSDIVYSKDNLIVDYFAVAHNRQHIIIQGKGTKHASDSLVVELSDVDVNYITNLVNFHSVEFGGKVSGRACVRSAFNNPDAHADIRVNRFTFEDGRMGTLFANVRWNKEEKQIDRADKRTMKARVRKLFILRLRI